MAVYREIFSRENSMELSGKLLGYRDYSRAFRSSRDEVCTTYKYKSLFSPIYAKKIWNIEIDEISTSLSESDVLDICSRLTSRRRKRGLVHR
jgi:hypothetical protein